jgi:hypothetical protein
VERLFKTVQDRLVKELRLAGIATIEAANRFVEAWLPSYNRRFAVQPAQAADLHRPKPAGGGLNRILCIKTTRCLRLTGRWSTTGTSIRYGRMSERPTSSSKTEWMGRCGSPTMASH